jgi:hypothetical protein
VLAILGLVWRVAAAPPPGSRTLIVGAENAGGLPRTVADALRAARPGDVVRIEPGVYRERVVVPGGVSLVARVPGSVTFARAAGSPGEWVALTAVGDAGGRISGVRIESTPQLPVDVGLRASGHGRLVELLEVAGPVRIGVDVLPESALSLYGCQFAVQGTAVNLRERAQAAATVNTFLRTGRTGGPAIARGEGAQLSVKRNVFVGFGNDIVKGAAAAERQEIAAANAVLALPPAR